MQRPLEMELNIISKRNHKCKLFPASYAKFQAQHTHIQKYTHKSVTCNFVTLFFFVFYLRVEINSLYII